MFSVSWVVLLLLFLFAMGEVHRRSCSRRTAVPPSRYAFTLVELLVVVFILGIIIALLLAALTKVRKSAMASKLAAESGRMAMPETPALVEKSGPGGKAAGRPLARVKTFAADIELTPKLSIGTAEPESIYEARFSGILEAVQSGDLAGECELQLPLPPAIISLADLSVRIAGQPSEQVVLRDGKLVWQGRLGVEPTLIAVTYTAVGKGLYELSVPPASILDHFRITLATHGSDVRMLELSLQPTGLDRSAGDTTYTWDYKQLLTGQPIRLDVLGIAPIDRLGELTWLGPLSVVVFGLLLGLTIHAFGAVQFDRWMLLLTVGTFAGCYPLMYFAQEFIPLQAAVLVSAGLMLTIIGVRAVTSLGFRLALAGVVLPAGVILSVTLLAAVMPRLQGILLTGVALAFFVAAMTLIPRLRPTASAAPIEPAVA